MKFDKLPLSVIRNLLGLSQEEASKRIGVSKKTLCNWEKGRTYPSAKLIERICEVYDVTYDQIYFLHSSPLKTNGKEV